MAIDDQYSQKHGRSPCGDRDMSSKRHKHRHDDLEEGEIIDDDDDRSVPQSHQPNLAAIHSRTSRTSRNDEKLTSVNGASKHHPHSERKESDDRDGSKLGTRHQICERSRSKSHDRAARDHRGHERYSRDRDRGHDHRDYSRERDRKRDSERGRSRETERDRLREKEGERSRDRKREREQRHKRERERDTVSERRHRDRDESDMQQRHRRSRNSEHDENKDPQPNSSAASLRRDDDGREDYDDTPTLQLAEQEEEDLNRIKEESRRRKQAILEKYKNKQKTPTESENAKQEDLGHTGLPKSPPNSDRPVVDHSPAEASFSVGKSPPLNGAAEAGGTGVGGLGEGTPKSERLDGVFCDDMFGETPTGVRKTEKSDGPPIERSGLHDNWDDAEGYYSYRFGELLDGRYEITAAHGKGVFSTVVRARNVKTNSGEPEEVAIKIIRSNETMYKAGMTELVILKKLASQDPEDKRHCVRFLSNFKYRNHLCLVFESLSMNLREVLKKFGRNIGLKLTAVRVYAKQLFIALKHLKNCGVLHCDIKPDNMLVNEAKNVLKLCDFGNAMFAGKNEVTPYLVSRFYRAPEIILGLTYDHPLDIWSVGCCLYELYTGTVLFRGATNNDMLRLHMELKGLFPKKMLRKGAFTNQNFDQDLNFQASEEDPVSKKTIKRLIPNIKTKDIGSTVVGYPGEDPKMLSDFKDLLDKMFTLDPDKRLTVSQALSHPFITGK